MNELARNYNRTVKRQLREKLVSWQRCVLGLFVLSVAANAALFGLYQGAQTRWQTEEARFQERIEAAEHVRDLAVQELGAMSLRWVEEQQARGAQTEAYAAIDGYRYIGECTITAYCCEVYPHICGTGDGLTATGIPVSPGVAAVDPDVIPFGSTVIIDGQRYLAADTGAAVNGLHVDIAVPTHEEAEAFGVQTAAVWIIPPGSVSIP